MAALQGIAHIDTLAIVLSLSLSVASELCEQYWTRQHWRRWQWPPLWAAARP